MNNIVLDHRIYMLQDFIEHVNYLTGLMDNSEFDEDKKEDIEAQLSLALHRFQTHKKSLKHELEVYFNECKNMEIPVYINYYRVYKEL